jgi:hypothetical protein
MKPSPCILRAVVGRRFDSDQLPGDGKGPVAGDSRKLGQILAVGRHVALWAASDTSVM